MKYIDTHAHLDLLHDQYTPDLSILEGIITISTKREHAQALQEFCREKDPWVKRTVGIHPGYLTQEDVEWEWLDDAAQGQDVVAIGEIGLDSLVSVPMDLQEKAFRAQIQVAIKHNLPIVMHIRGEVEDLLMEILKDYSVRGVAHCYTGSQALADFLLDRGLYISISGIATYKNADTVRSVAKRVPLDRLLIETDSPYLTPDPIRKKTKHNKPEYVSCVGEAVAVIRGISPGEVAAQVRQNVRDLFGV